MTATFAAQSFGNLGVLVIWSRSKQLSNVSTAACLVALVVVAAYKSDILSQVPSYPIVDHCWRLLIGLRCIPGCVALYFRLTISEIPRFTLDIACEGDVPEASWSDFRKYFCRRKNGKVFLGTAWSWFTLDVYISSSFSNL